MSVHILYDAAKRKSVMYCSTDGKAFGPLFADDDAADFADWMSELDRDPRTLHESDLAIAIETWEEDFYATTPDAL